MNIVDKFRIKSNPNVIDKYHYNEEKLIYAIQNGYKFNPEKAASYIVCDLYRKQFQKDIYDLAIKNFDEGKDILSLICSLDKSNRLQLVEERPEILSKYSSSYHDYIDEIKDDYIAKYFDINKIYTFNERLLKIFSAYPDKFIAISNKCKTSDIVDVIKNNLDLYFYLINNFNDKFGKELFPTIKEYALNNKIRINDKYPKVLLADEDFLVNYLVIDPDYAKNIDGDIKINNEHLIAKSIYESDNILPYPVYGIYEKYDKIKSYIILKHKEFVNDTDKLYLIHLNCYIDEVYQYLKDANYPFDENTPSFLYNNEFVLRELLSNGVKFKTDVALNILPKEEVFELYKQNYTIDDIEKYNLFRDNPLIVEWGLKNGLSIEKVFDKLDIKDFSEFKDKTIIIKKPSVENINKVVLFIKLHPDIDVDKISINITDTYNGIENNKLVDYTNLQFLNGLKNTNINITFFIADEEKTLDEMILNEQLLEKIADEIKNSPLSTFEKYIAAYDVVKMFKDYKDYGFGLKGRAIHSIMSGKYMVCAGYANLLENLLLRIGIPCVELSCNAKKGFHAGDENGHARNYVYIKDSKYNIDGYYQCDTTWEGHNDYSYCNLLIRNDYAYENDLEKKESDKIQQLCEGNVSLHDLKDALERLDPLLFEKYLSNQISDEEFVSEASSKLNKKVDLDTILEAIKNTKKAVFKDDSAVDYYMRVVCALIDVCDFCSLEEAIECKKNVSEFRKQNNLDIEHATYGDVLNSNIFEHLDKYIDLLIEEVKKKYKNFYYDDDEKCIRVGVHQNDTQMIDYYKNIGTLNEYYEDYLLFTIPYELDPNLTVKEQAEAIMAFVYPMELDVSNKKAS